MGEQRELYGLEKVKGLWGEVTQPSPAAAVDGSRGIQDIMNLVPGRGDLSIIPPSVQHSIDVLKSVQAMGEGFKRQFPYTPEEWIERGLGYIPTFWEDPRRVARFYQGVQSLPSDATLPDWLNREQLDAAYNYLKYRNKSTPWYEWKFLNVEDPARQFLQQMITPPPEMLMPEELTRYIQQQEQQAEIEAGAIQAMAWPEKDSPEWEALPGWMKVAMTTMASGTWYGQAIGGALTLGPWGAVTGFMSGGPAGALVGGISGGLLGGGIALGTGAAQRWLEDFREKHPEAEWTSGASKALENILLTFDVGAEVLERGMGVGVQIKYAMDDPERWGPVSEIFDNFMASWRAGTQFYTALPLEQLFPGGAEPGEKWVLGEPEPVREVMDPRTGEMVQIPQPEDTWDAFALFADELTRCRRELMEGTKSPDELVQEMAIKYGWSGQFTELAAHIVLDPGPWVARRGPTMGLKALGGLTGNDAMVVAADLAKRMKREGIFGNLRAYGQVLRLDTPIEQVTAGGLLTRYLGQVTAEGEPALLRGPTGPLGWLAGLTPRARAVEVLGITSDTAKILMDQFTDPLEVGVNWRKIAATPGQAAEDLSMRFIEAPDGMLTVMAMRDFGDGPLRTLETQWVSTELQRSILSKVAKLKGISEFEFLRLLDDAEQAPALFKSIMDEATRTAATDPAAAELVKAAQAGQFTEQTLRDLFKLYMTEGIAFHPEHWKAQLYDAWMTHVADWTVQRLGVRVEPMVQRLSNLMKSVQSIALLDVNPLYAINNGVNNISTMIIDGTFRLKTIKNALKWWDDFGLRPYRLRQAYGGPAGLEEFAGKSLAQLQKLAAESPEAARLVSEIKASRAVADAATGDGALTSAQRWVGDIRRKVGFASAASRRIEEWSSVQATTAGTQQFWSRSWRAGVGYSRMPPALEGILGPEISRMVYGMVEGALNADQLESALLKQATIRGTVESFINDVAKDLGQDPGDVAEIMQRSGATEFLNVHLADAKTPDEVRGVFSMLDQHIQRHVDQLAVSEYVSRAKHAAAQIQAGDYTGFLETWFYLNRTVDEWWTKHVMDWSLAVEEASNITDGKQRNQIIAARMATANSEATRMQSFEMAAIEGMVEGLRDLGVDAPEGYVRLLQSQHQGNRDFFKLRDDLWREYFRTDFESKQSKRLRYSEIVHELDARYGRLALETLQTQEQMDMGVVNMIARTDPELADGFNNWLTDVRERRAVMIGREQNVRRANYDILTGDQATGKSFTTIIQAHFASDPEFLTAISPWLQQLRARRGRLRYDDILTIRRRLYAEYLNHLKLPDIKDYFERRNQGLVEALGQDITRPLPMPEAPEIPTPELPSRFESIQQDFETGRAQVVMSSSDLLEIVRRADENVVRLTTDQTRPGAGGSSMPLWDQAGDIDAATIEGSGQTPGAYWWGISNAEVRDGILGLPEIKGSEEAAKGFLETIYNARQGPEVPAIDVRQIDNDMIRTLAWEQGGISTTSDSGAPLNAYLINWINSILGLRDAGTPIKRLDDLTDPQRLAVRHELYKRGQYRGVMEEEAIRTRMTVEALEVLDDWGQGKQCGVRKMRRLGIHNGLNKGEAASMSADEIYSWLRAKRTGQPYTGPRFMTPEVLRDSFVELSGGDTEVAAATMALVEAAAIAKGMSVEEYISKVFARSLLGEDPLATQQLFQLPANDAVTFRYEQAVKTLMEALIEQGQSEDAASTFMARLTTDEPWAKFVTGDLDSLRALMYEYRDAHQEVDYMERVGRPITFGDVVSRSEMRSGKPVDADVRQWFGDWQLFDKNTDRVLRIFPTEEAARAAADAVNRQGIYEDTALPYTLLQRSDRNSPLIARAVEMFGTTEIPAEAGFMLPDGRMLDFSGRSHGTKDMFGGPLSNGRLLDHTEVSQVYRDAEIDYATPFNARDQFIAETGSIRITFNRSTGKPWLGLQLSGPLSIEQVIAIHKILGEHANGMLRIDCLDPVTNKLIKDLWVDGLTRESINQALFDVDSVYSLRQPGKGAVTFLDDGRAVMKALGNPDATTCIHELGHVFRRQLPNTDMDIVVKWWQEQGKLKISHEQGSLVGDDPTIRQAEEMWARGFERYMAEGVAPIPSLQSVFERFKRWVMAIYQKITGSAIDVELTNEVRGLMDRILAQDPQTARDVAPGFDWTGGEVRAPVAPVPSPEPSAIEPPSARPGMDLHDWQVARNAELRQAATIEEPQARIAAVEDVISRYDKVKHRQWVTSRVLQGRILAQANAEIRVVEGLGGLTGAGTAAHGPDPNVQFEFVYRVMELNDLIASHNRQGNPNPDYPDYLQPRDRARAVSQQQVQRIAGDLNSDALLMPTTRIDDGTPIIGEDAIVESGNARIIALQEAALSVPDSFAAYRDRMIELLVGSVDEYGEFDFEQIRAMEQPVLVRMRTSEVDRVEFTRLANESATMGMSFVESAQADVNRLTVDSLAGLHVPEEWGLEQALRSPSNRGFVQGFVDQLPRNEIAMVVDPDGALSRLGIERLIAAMFAKTYGGEAGVRLVRTVFESNDINVRNIAKALTASLGEMSKAEALIAADRRPLSLSIGEDLAASVDMLNRLKQRGITLDKYFAQLPLLTKELTPFQETLMLELSNMSRSPTAIRQVLEEYARLVQRQPDVDQLGLFGKVEYPSKTELWERAKQGPQQTFFQLPEQSRMGSVEGIPPEMWMSQVTSDGWDQIRPVIDAMKEKMAGPDGWTREIGMDDVQTRLNAEQQQEFRDWVRGVRGEMASTKMGSVRWGESARDLSLLNYNARRGLDVGITMGMPYWFWFGRTFLNWVTRAVDRPALIANLARIRHLQSHYQTVPGFPQRLQGKVRIPMPFLPEWMGGGLWVDPLRSMFPPAMFMSLVDRVANVKNREVGKAEYIISTWVVEGKVDSAAAEQSLVTQEGDIWERAIDQARLEEGEQFSGPLDYMSLLTSFSLPIEVARQYAKGTPENIGPLPITRIIKGVTAPLGIGGPGGINIEAPIRRAADLPEYDRFEDYRIERMVSNMIADGVVSPEEGEMAMHEHRGDAWDEAERRVNMARFYGTYANPLFWFGFPADSFPTGEVEQRALSRKWSAALEARNAGDDTALRDFLEEYPEYKSRLDLFKDPEERLRYFLVDEIWTRYMALGSANKEMARMQLGEDFMYSFLSDETRGYEDIPINVLAFWAKRLGGYLPETPDNRIEIPEEIRETPGVELLDPRLSLAVDTYRELRNTKHPNWFAVQQGYYELPPGTQRRNYLVRFPMLKKYWDWKRQYFKDHPEVAAYNQRYDLETQEGEVIGSLSVPEILTNSALMRQILGNRMTGEPLSSGALAELYRIWEGLNRPFDDIDTWIKNLNMTP